MMNLNIDIPMWATIIIITLWTVEKIIDLISKKCFHTVCHKIRMFLFYHNDEEFYKQKIAANKAKQALCREQYRMGGKYRATSVADLLKKQNKKK